MSKHITTLRRSTSYLRTSLNLTSPFSTLPTSPLTKNIPSSKSLSPSSSPSSSHLRAFSTDPPANMSEAFHPPNTSPTYRILGVQQIAVGSPSLSGLRSLWVDTLGAREVKTFKSESENVDEIVTTLGRGVASVEVDLMTPLDPSKSPKVDKPPLNHIGLWVTDIRACYDHLSEQGYKFTPGGIRPGASGYDVCFIHPKPKEGRGGEGVLIELVQAPEKVIDAYDTIQDI